MKPITPREFPWKDYRRYTYPLGLDLGAVALLSGHTASRYDAATDKIVSTGDLKTQAATAVEKIRVILEAAGYACGDVVSIVQYVPPGAFGELAALDALLRESGMGQATRHVVPVTRLLRRDALVELEVMAARRDAREGDAHAVRVRSGNRVLTLLGEMHAGEASLAEQVASIAARLEKAGAAWSDVARCRLVVATEDPAALEAAAGELARLVPQLAVVPAVGVAAFPAGAGRSLFSVELAAGEGAPARLEAGGLVRRAGPFLVATGLRADAGDGIVAQAEQVYGRLVPQLLAAAGLGMEALVQTVEWLTLDALPDYKNTGAVRRNALREPFPVSSGLVCSALPGGAKLAVDLVALAP